MCLHVFLVAIVTLHLMVHVVRRAAAQHKGRPRKDAGVMHKNCLCVSLLTPCG